MKRLGLLFLSLALGLGGMGLLAAEDRPPDFAEKALLSRDAGQAEEAAGLWLKSTLAEGADGFLFNQLAWSRLSAGRLKEARDAFLKAIDRSQTTASQAEANIGLGIAALRDSRPREAMAPLRSALVQGQYVLALASYQTALTALALGDRKAALAFLRQSADLDPLSLESLRELARLYERIGEKRSALRLYHRLASLDPGDEDSRRRLRSLARSLPGDQETALAPRRLSRPLLEPEGKGGLSAAGPGAALRVALFASEEGKPAAATRLGFMANSPFRLLALPAAKTSPDGARDGSLPLAAPAAKTSPDGARDGSLPLAVQQSVLKEEGKGLEEWELGFRPESGQVEVRDASRNIRYGSAEPFRIVPSARQGSVLLKDARFARASGFDAGDGSPKGPASGVLWKGVDAGDRELRGSIEVIPGPDGFKLVNEIPLEDYLYGVVGGSLPEGSPPEAYKAQAVVSRTRALWFKSRAAVAPNPEKSELCDSAACQKYLGVNEELREASQAVSATEGMALTRDGRAASVLQHADCGGLTESGRERPDLGEDLGDLVPVADGPRPDGGPRTPMELERWIHEFPPADCFCAASRLTPASESRWMRLIDARDLERRARRVRDLGSIRRISAVRRSSTGRVLALEVEGSAGRLTLEGEKAIADFLSPGSLRSTLFTIQPLMNGRSADRFLLWGAGTGHGLGMCAAGAVGQAGLGRDWREILAHYFPKFKIGSLSGAQRPAGRGATK